MLEGKGCSLQSATGNAMPFISTLGIFPSANTVDAHATATANTRIFEANLLFGIGFIKKFMNTSLISLIVVDLRVDVERPVVADCGPKAHRRRPHTLNLSLLSDLQSVVDFNA